MDLKNIYIGEAIKKRVLECKMDIHRICKFLNTSEEEIKRMYTLKSLDAEIILRWSKLLEYDFFRIYTQHLILFSPAAGQNKSVIKKESELPKFRKNIYTKEIIDFVLDQIASKEKTPAEIINHYRIPKTTLYKWIKKYGK